MSHIVLVAKLDVKPEYTKDVITFFQSQLIEQSRLEAGNIQYDLHQGREDANTLVMYEIWASQEALNTHNKTEHFNKFKDYIGDKISNLEITLLDKL